MSTLYIRLASKAVADSAPHWPELPCPFALISNGNLSHGSTIERQGTAPLSELSDTVAKSQRVVVLLAASDVSMLRLQVPPLSSARLKAALPNLVEEKLLADPADCVVVAGGLSGGLRTVAVIQRAWLDILVKTLIAFGARHIAALPAQLCLSYQSDQPGSVTVAISDRNDGGQNGDIDMTLRLSEQDGIGLTVAHEQDESAPNAAIRTLCAMIPEAPITLYVPQSAVRAYQEVVNNTIALSKRINVSADNWSHWIAGTKLMTLDLMAGLGTGTDPKLDWRPWRWPLTLAVVVLVINTAALNIDWWHLKGETSTLRAAMIQTYKLAYPKESVIIDPIAQMQQKIATAKHDSGLAAPDDFIALTAAFGEAWSNIVNASTDKSTLAIAALEYRERSLFVHLKPGGKAPTQQIKDALTKRGLSLNLASLDLAPHQSGAVIWKIRSDK